MRNIIIEKLRQQSHNKANDPYIGKMRMLAGDIFKQYQVPEFDYKKEMQTLGSWLSGESNYNYAFDLVSNTTTLGDDEDVDHAVILGAFALCLGNPIEVDDDGSVSIYIPDDFASKSGISGVFDVGIGGWERLEIRDNGVGKKRQVNRPFNIVRKSIGNREVLDAGVEGIKRTAENMVAMTRQYIKDRKFDEDRRKLKSWMGRVFKNNNVSNDSQKQIAAISGVLTNSNVVRYQKDPVMLKHDERSGKTKLASHEWLVAPARTIESGVADCDDFTLVLGAVSMMLGLGVDYRVAKCNPARKDAYSHVYNVIHYPHGIVDGISGDDSVIVDVVYMKRMRDGSRFMSAYGKEPKNYGIMDYSVN